MDRTSLVKVFLHDRGQDVESAWCQPVAEKGGVALFRLVNVPFLHEKPTFGDVIAAVRSDDGNWEWDRDGVSDARMRERLHEDGGRYALIVDYTMRTDADFGALVQALERQHDIVAEGCFGPRGEEPGRLYLAAPRTLTPQVVMALVTTLGRGFRFVLVHPTPERPKKRKAAAGPRPTKKSAGAAKAKAKGAKAKTSSAKAKTSSAKAPPRAKGRARPRR